MTPPLLAFYGDDFTGASAVLEVLTFAGVPSVMFLAPPDADHLARFPDAKAVGIAGVSRSRGPEWMRTHLPQAFRSLAASGAPVVHYKVCSTFDSSPTMGSIGCAIDIGAPIVGGDWQPLLVAAPPIGRYQTFGHLFAEVDGSVHRLDRHPVMSTHPVTPMDESDLGRHLAAQTDRRIGLVDLAALKNGHGLQQLEAERSAGASIVSIDAVDDETLVEAGRLIWGDGRGPVLAVGSQGVEYALVEHWRRLGLISSPIQYAAVEPVEQLFGVSGSCSPITAGQIQHAEDHHGFAIVEVDAAAAVEPGAWREELERVLDYSLQLLGAGRDVLAVTARGPDDPRAATLETALRTASAERSVVNDRLGAGLGWIIAEVRRMLGLPRVVVAGGDTSSHAVSALGVHAIQACAPLAPGAPLCVLTSDDPVLDGLEITLKGGQMGGVDFFAAAKGDRSTASRT